MSTNRPCNAYIHDGYEFKGPKEFEENPPPTCGKPSVGNFYYGSAGDPQIVGALCEECRIRIKKKHRNLRTEEITSLSVAVSAMTADVKE